MLSLLSNLNRLIFCKFLPGFVLLQSLLGGNLHIRIQRASIGANPNVYVNKTEGKNKLENYDKFTQAFGY